MTRALVAALGALGLFATSSCDLVLGITDVPMPASPDAESPASSCGETTADPHNCGVCGHNCLGGSCSNSTCQPVAIVPAGVSPWGLAGDDTYLYWTDNNNASVERTNKISGATDVLNQGTTLYPTQIVADAANLYWGDASGVWRCPKTGCSQNPPVLAANEAEFQVTSLGIDDTNIYWSENIERILVAPKNGNNLQPATLWSAGAMSNIATNRVVTDGTRVYFTANDGLLRAVTVDGGAAALAIGNANSNGSFGVAVDGANVYWTVPDPSKGVVDEAPTSLLSRTSLASGQYGPTAIASDGTTVYWAASTSPVLEDASTEYAVFGCTVGACTPATLGTGYTNVKTIVTDATAIYWTDLGDGTSGAIWKLAK